MRRQGISEAIGDVSGICIGATSRAEAELFDSKVNVEAKRKCWSASVQLTWGLPPSARSAVAARQPRIAVWTLSATAVM